MDDMTERRRPTRGRGTRRPAETAVLDENPYRESESSAAVDTVPTPVADAATPTKRPRGRPRKTPIAPEESAPAPVAVAVRDEAPAASAEAAPRRRGRPPRRSTTADETPVSSAPPAATTARDAEPRDAAPREDARPTGHASEHAARDAESQEQAPRDSAARERPPRDGGGRERHPRGRHARGDAPREHARRDGAPREPLERSGGDVTGTGDATTGEAPAREWTPREGRDGDSRFERRGRFRRRGRGRNRFRDERGGDEAPPRDRGPREPHAREHAPRDHVAREREREGQAQGGRSQLVIEGEVSGWFDPARGDGGFIRRANASYLPQPTDPFLPGWMVRQFQLRRADLVTATWGWDPRRRPAVAEVLAVNGAPFDPQVRRKDFQSLTATYPEQRLTLETGAPARVGQEVTRRVIDLIAPIGYGQRALIVAPARAGKTTLLQAITEGVHRNHPNAVLMLLLVDERPEEVSEAISWNVGEVIASSFDQPAQRHVDVTEMVMERARRLVELGKDVVIVLDSITRMGRAFNTANRGTGRTLSGGLDAAAMAKPKAFFGSARAVAPADGGGSLTIIATALVETGSRMDDVIFEEFKGTGNCEIKLDRSLSERRIFPAIDIPASGTRREEKLYKPDQLQAIYMLRRGLQAMPAVGAMEWLIKRILATPHNDALLTGL